MANALNFASRYFETGKKFQTVYGGGAWRGTHATFACLIRVMEDGIRILDNHWLVNVSLEWVEAIFEGDSQIPLPKERWAILREVSQVLCQRYGGSFQNFVAQHHDRLFGEDELSLI